MLYDPPYRVARKDDDTPSFEENQAGLFHRHRGGCRRRAMRLCKYGPDESFPKPPLSFFFFGAPPLSWEVEIVEIGSGNHQSVPGARQRGVLSCMLHVRHMMRLDEPRVVRAITWRRA